MKRAVREYLELLASTVAATGEPELYYRHRLMFEVWTNGAGLPASHLLPVFNRTAWKACLADAAAVIAQLDDLVGAHFGPDVYGEAASEMAQGWAKGKAYRRRRWRAALDKATAAEGRGLSEVAADYRHVALCWLNAAGPGAVAVASGTGAAQIIKLEGAA